MTAVLPVAGAALLAVAVPLLVYGLVPVASPRAEAATPGTPVPSAVPRIVPRGLRGRLERSAQLAGLPVAAAVRRTLRAKLGATLLALAVGALLVAAVPGPGSVVLVLAVAGIAFLAPDLLLASRARERQERIRRELPDALDQITIAIEAGLGLETAVARTGRHGTGPLAEELTRTIQDMRVGLSRRDAWRAFAARTDVADARRFARAVMQADEYGVSIGHVVRTQAKELRVKRRQRAEERAMKVPVAILFPLMFCILPVLFVVVLGPAVLNLLAVLGTLP